MATPTNSGDQSDMASEEHFNLTRYFSSPSPPPSFQSLSNSMVVDYQWSGQSSMDNPLQNQQQNDENLVDPPQNLARDSALWEPPLTPPAPPISRSKPYAGISQRPTNSGESDMATEDLDVTSFLISPQWSPPRSTSSSNSMVVYQRSGQSSMDNPLRHQHQHEDFVDRSLYITGPLVLWRQKLLTFWNNESDRRGILTMKKQNLPQSLECLGISLLNLYVEDEFYPLYRDGESWQLLSVYMTPALDIFVPGENVDQMTSWHDSVDMYTQVLIATQRISMGVWRIGPREWVAKIRYHRLSLPLPTPSFLYDADRYLYWKSEFRRLQVVMDDARLHFPELDIIFHKEELRGKLYDQEEITQLNPDTLLNLGVTCDTNSCVVEEITPLQFSPTFQQENPDEDSNNDEVEPVGMGVVGTGKEIVPFNEMHLKDAARELKVSDSHLDETPAIDDEEGFPQLNSDTLPSDQASAVTVDMNSVVVKVIQPLQFLPTTQQENEDEVFGNDEVEEVQICLERTESDGMSRKDAAKDLTVVDEEGSPQLINSDNLPSVQAAAVTVDTNSVVGKEIPPLQFSRTTQQKNSDEAFVNEEGEIWANTTEENGIADVQFDSRCSAKRKRKEKNPRRERRNKKTTGVRIGTPLDDILQTKGRSSLKDDAKHRKEGTSRNTSRGGLAGSNVDVNTAGGQASSKKRLTSFSGKRVSKPCFRSSLGGIMTLIKELNLRTCHKEVLKRTPFWRMFEAIIENKLSPTQCHQRGKMIIEIINTYDPVTGKFRLGRQSIELTRANMVSIFGISCGKEFVSLKYGCKEDVKLVARREISESRLTSTSLKQLLEKYEGSDEKDDVEDVARLLCVYLCHTFFFPTGTTVKWVYLERIEDLDRLRDYDWNEAITNELMSSIRKHHREPRKVTGCVIALMYWLCERTNLSKADDSEHPLGIVKWNIPVVVSKLKKIRLKDLKPHQVVSRQANVAGTADDEVSVDKDIVQDSVSSRDVPVSNQGNNACSGNEKMDEKTRRGERVSRSKLKRVRRDYNMNKWPPREVQKLIGQSQPNESPAVDDQERIPQLNSDTPLPSNQNSGTSNTNCVTVMAKYKGLRIKFQLSWPWRKLELEQQVKKRLQLDATTYYINYKDEDDEMTLIGCDEDLEDYISSTSHLGTRSIDLFLEPK